MACKAPSEPQPALFPEVHQAPGSQSSVFAGIGFRGGVDALLDEIRELYLADSIPWVVGYSGGKDSTATLQLTWLAVRGLPPEQRTKKVYVISTDTLVENPIVAAWAGDSLEAMRRAAASEQLPIEVHRLTPKVEDSFWTLLIGKGYPAPRRMFRWCTDRLKIRPSNAFITRVISQHGECILLLGTRKAESADRSRRMVALEAQRVRDLLSPNASLPGSLVYSPIEEWSNDDVWLFLLQIPNPWGWSNKTLMNLYAGASDGGECPVVVDTSTPSCGASRFGCWTCTLVEQDKSMAEMVQNDEQKEWMLPLLDLRNALDFRDNESGDRHLRDFRRMNGRVQLMGVGDARRVIPGPYLQSARADWLRRLLDAQTWIRRRGPEHVRRIELITLPELEAIRRIWTQEKHEVEDLLPGIYEAATGEAYPGAPIDLGPIRAEDLALLRDITGDDAELYAAARDLLAVTHRFRQRERRAGLFRALETTLRRYSFGSAEEAVEALRPATDDEEEGDEGPQRSLLGMGRPTFAGAPAPLAMPMATRASRALRALSFAATGETHTLATEAAENLDARPA